MQLDNYELTKEEQGHLAASRGSEGFKVLNKLLKAEVFKKIHGLINTPTADETLVVKRHTEAIVSAEIYAGFIKKINESIAEYLGSRGAGSSPENPLELDDSLDLGDFIRGE